MSTARAAVLAGAMLALLALPARAAEESGDARSTDVGATSSIVAHAEQAIIELPVTFQVRNVNRSGVPCSANGANATIVGRLVGPETTLTAGDAPATVSLYLHEFTFGKWLWGFPDPDYNYAARLADRGHVSVIVDRLGYGESKHPGGYGTCLGADADIAHQMVTQLRAGSYQLEGGDAPAFDRVVLAGHSGGGMSALISAYSFGGIDGLMLFSHADRGFSGYGTDQGLRQGLACALGGEPSHPGGPGGYAYFGKTRSEWRRNFFHNADPAVVETATELRHRDPCGNVGSFPTGALVNSVRAREVRVPVLLLYASQDSLYDNPAAGRNQQQLFGNHPDVTLRFFDGGHALPLQRSAPELRATVSEWLDERGLS